MATAKVGEQQLMTELAELFQQHGYEGTSYARISEKTGLVKASLYHRFPEGKAQVADQVLAHVDRIFAGEVLAPFAGEDSPQEQLAEVQKRLLRFYGRGKRACLLETLTLDRENERVMRHARKTMEFWVAAFAEFSRQHGAHPEEARERAERAVASLEGALIVGRVLGGTAAFRRAVEELEALLLG